MSAPVIRSEVRTVVAAVRTALDDLSPEEVEELTGGLEADLDDALADAGPPGDSLGGQGDPAASLGDPEVYAAELRAAAGLPPRARGGERPGGPAQLEALRRSWQRRHGQVRDPYEAQGRPLSGVQLFDEKGNPLAVGTSARTPLWDPDGNQVTQVPGVGRDSAQLWNVFPLRQQVIPPYADPAPSADRTMPYSAAQPSTMVGPLLAPTAGPVPSGTVTASPAGPATVSASAAPAVPTSMPGSTTRPAPSPAPVPVPSRVP
jgi:hypothetical protein